MPPNNLCHGIFPRMTLEDLAVVVVAAIVVDIFFKGSGVGFCSVLYSLAAFDFDCCFVCLMEFDFV